MLPCFADAGDLSDKERARQSYVSTQARFEIHPNDFETAWQFARAAFDWAEFASDKKQRETIALRGIAAARRAVEVRPESAEAHYYLAMNLGQLARTRSLGALKLVDEMEAEFKKARELDNSFDYAGPDRNLGILYLEAPATISVGDRAKARKHLAESVKLSPHYPSNRLNLIEAFLKWNDPKSAQVEMKELDKIWAAARKEFDGPEWKGSWVEWEQQRERFRARIQSMLPRR